MSMEETRALSILTHRVDDSRELCINRCGKVQVSANLA